MSKKRNVFIELLKIHTNIDVEFINTFFKKFEIGSDLEFHIKDSDVANYLKINIQTLRDKLENKLSKTKYYLEKADYMKDKTGKGSGVTYYLNYTCFERIVMGSDTIEAEVARLYFMKLREFLVENQHVIFQAMQNKQELKKYEGYESIYFFAIDPKNQDIFKLGKLINIIRKLRRYNVGKIDEDDLKYYTVVSDSKMIEKCIMVSTKKPRVFSDKEIIKIKPEDLRKIITQCYCANTSKTANRKLHREIAGLIGLYSYVVNNPKVEPHVIISNQ